MASSGVSSSIANIFGASKGVSNIPSGASTQEGDIHDYLPPMLGDRLYTKLCEDVDLALEEIHYCQEGLQKRQRKDLINHDYLVLKLRPGDSEAVYIKAHKGQGGIYIEHIPSIDVTRVFHEGVHCFTVTCDKKRIRLEAVVAILKIENPDYSVIGANCWNYAQKTAKRLVKACIETPGISSAERARLQEEHDNLEANLVLKHFQYVAQSLFSKVVTSLFHCVTPKSSRVSISEVSMAASSLPNSTAILTNSAQRCLKIVFAGVIF